MASILLAIFCSILYRPNRISAPANSASNGKYCLKPAVPGTNTVAPVTMSQIARTSIPVLL